MSTASVASKYGPCSIATAVVRVRPRSACDLSWLTSLERVDCLSQRDADRRVAGRLAAKQAVMLTLQRSGACGAVDPRDFEIRPQTPIFPRADWWRVARQPVCAPTATSSSDLADALGRTTVSISHQGHVAVAAAVIRVTEPMKSCGVRS